MCIKNDILTVWHILWYFVCGCITWTLVKTVRSIVIRSLSGVHIGDDLCLSDWRDPRLDVKYKK